MRRPTILLIASMAALLAFSRVQVRAQSDAKPLTFDVVSIKPSPSDAAGGSMGFQPGGRFRAVNIPVLGLILSAYGVERPLLGQQIVGDPPWLSTSRVDIDARADPSLPSDIVSLSKQMPGTLRTLLADRFKLKAHFETRQQPTYALVKARSDGRLGPALYPSTIDCVALSQQRRDNPAAAPLPSICGMRFGTGSLSGSMTILNLTITLSGTVQRIVVDRSGLAGYFDVDLHWSEGLPNPDARPDEAVSIFTALQEQLGLKLESTSGPVDVLVIDHVEHPTPD